MGGDFVESVTHVNMEIQCANMQMCECANSLSGNCFICLSAARFVRKGDGATDDLSYQQFAHSHI